jgi:uncharacterized membrane protein
MTWYIGTCDIIAMGLLYRSTLWSNVCVCVGFRSNVFVIKAHPFSMDGHYRTDIISSVGHPRLDSIVPLMLYMVVVQWLGH